MPFVLVNPPELVNNFLLLASPPAGQTILPLLMELSFLLQGLLLQVELNTSSTAAVSDQGQVHFLKHKEGKSEH